MKICDEKESLKFEDLEVGDVFKWKDDDGPVWKTSKGYAYLQKPYSGQHYNVGNSDTSKVIRYPNACITLGDPE